MGEQPQFLLVKRGMYYKPGNQGYTGVKDRAGRYLEAEASPGSGVVAIHESRAPFFAPGFSPACVQEFMARFHEQVPELDRRCVAIADLAVPEYRRTDRSYSCGGTMAKRWQAAHDGARLAFTSGVGVMA